MGRSYTPKYVIDLRHQGIASGTQEWRVKSAYGQLKGYGTPNHANLSLFVERFNNALKKGGANEHIGMRGIVVWAGIRENYQGAPYLAEFNAPKFEAIEPSEYLK